MLDFSALPLVIEPADVFERLGCPHVRLIDVSSLARYHQLHIAGALCVEPRQTQSLGQVVGMLPSQEVLEALLGHLGYHVDMTYVVYDDEGGGWAGRFIWLLDCIGHKHYHYLNGGLRAWLDEGYPTSVEVPSVSTTTPSLTIHHEYTATLSYLQGRLGAEDLAIWDARSVEEYDGERAFALKAGHIPGAINVEWLLAMDRSKGFRIRHNIAERLAALGITKDKEVITYCQSHHRSGFTYLVAKALGYPRVKAYAGSWSEWGNSPVTEVED